MSEFGSIDDYKSLCNLMFDYALERNLVSYVSPKLLYEFTGFYFDDDILPGDLGSMEEGNPKEGDPLGLDRVER